MKLLRLFADSQRSSTRNFSASMLLMSPNVPDSNYRVPMGTGCWKKAKIIDGVSGDEDGRTMEYWRTPFKLPGRHANWDT